MDYSNKDRNKIIKKIIREKILETNFYLTEALLNNEVENIKDYELELESLFYHQEILNNEVEHINKLRLLLIELFKN